MKTSEFPFEKSFEIHLDL